MKKNIIYALFTFCFVLFTGTWALGQSQSSNEDIKIEVIDPEGYEVPLGNNNNNCSPSRIETAPFTFVISIYNFGYLPGDYVEGGQIPEMFLIAYTNNNLINENIVGITNVFSEGGIISPTPFIISSSPFSLPLNFLSNGDVQCSHNPAFPFYTDLEYQITLGWFNEEGEIESYFTHPIYTEMFWPQGVGFNFNNIIIEVEEIVCCVVDYLPDPSSSGIIQIQGTNAERIKEAPNVGDSMQLGSHEENISNLVNTQIFPNPFRNEITLFFNLEKNQNCTIKIIDSRGLIIEVKELQGRQGRNTHNLDLSSLLDGIYIVNVSTSKENWSKRILKE